MSLQYLEALRAIGASPVTKFVFPMEFTKLLQPFVDGCVALRRGRRRSRPDGGRSASARAPER
jgi:hypothetical protein